MLAALTLKSQPDLLEYLMKRRLITVSNRLPVTVGPTIRKSSGGLVKAMEGLTGELDLTWIGWAGGVIDSPQRQVELTRNLADEFGYQPVFLDHDDIDAYYDGFSNASLWPLLHYLPDYSRYQEVWFDSYLKVNQVFAEAVLQTYRGDEDVVWVHDYHLMLLPQMLRKAQPRMQIGYFLHTPFPSYEIFRCHPKRSELIEGLLGADLVGFHTYGYLRHFRSTVMRLLGIDSELSVIVHDRRRTALGVYPIGINARDFLEELDSPTCRESMDEYRLTFKSKKIVLSVERLDYTKGIPRKLDAIEHFLEHSEDRDRVVFIFICVPSRENVKEYQDLLEEVELRVGQINGRFATLKNSPIHFIHQSVPFSHLCAIYAVADVALVNPLIDGMNLVAKEYVACRQDGEGVLILSEFAGAAQELFNAIIVNPYDIQQVSESIATALTLPADQKRQMMEPMRNRVVSYDARHWANRFVSDLSQTARAEPPAESDVQIDMNVFTGYSNSRSIGFFLDYDGTLSEIRSTPEEARPQGPIDEILRQLSRHEQVETYLISGRKRSDMDEWFAGFGITLIAEHGFVYRKPGQRGWSALEPNADLTWKEQIVPMFQSYAAMTPGSFVEEKTSAVVWHYRRTDPEFGTWKAHQLLGELYEMTANDPVQVNHGKKIVEVNSSQINKGVAMERFSRRNGYQLTLCAGDDVTDESMFDVLLNDLITIKVGAGETRARYRIASPAQMRQFLSEALNFFSRDSL